MSQRQSNLSKTLSPGKAKTNLNNSWAPAGKVEVKTHRPKFHVGLNPTVYFSYSGFRPRGQYLEVLGLNPEVEKFDSGFRPRGHYLGAVGLNP